MTKPAVPFSADEAFARRMDAEDPLRGLRDRFHIPPGPDGRSSIYLCGNSLGLQPKATRAMIEQELADWARLGVDAHLKGRDPWLPFHEQFRESASRLVGGVPGEAVMMNSLTVNLHLLMVSFYRPTAERFKIVIEDSAFPSDSYAVASQLGFHGFDPRQGLIRLRPREGESALRTEDIEAVLEREGKSVALVLLGAVNYLTGQWFEMVRITAAAKRQGCTVGWDLAHAAGNVPMRLHDWNADFAAWCSYKYLNCGPGGVAGAWVHERHARDTSLPRFAGWWGNDPATRFAMGPEFHAREGADGWQLSNPPILALAPAKASMAIFDEVGMEAIRAKSLLLTGYMEFLIDRLPPGRVKVLTPREPAHRGAQLSLHVPGAGRALEKALHERGVFVDYREPDVVRGAPTALYNSFGDVYGFVEALRRCLKV